MKNNIITDSLGPKLSLIQRYSLFGGQVNGQEQVSFVEEVSFIFKCPLHSYVLLYPLSTGS